jgi:ThiF family
MKQHLERLSEIAKVSRDIYTPLFYRLSSVEDKVAFSKLLNNSTNVLVYDELIGQIEELIKSKNPKVRFTIDSLRAAAIEYLADVKHEEYGVWVYYPWNNKLVHILDEEEFVFVRTNRNHYKITLEEELLLSTKKIGVIGLSVGKAIAMTIAMERICGEIRIADFDVIELSNLNRIQTGVQNFGIKKTVVVAREIAEIDPYLKVTLFSEGLTENNVDDFFLKDGKLDVCIEVCDGLYTKIFSRQKAKLYGIPVVMNSSDRGTTDIERYDTNSELPLLHGLIDHLDLDLVKSAKTNEEKVPYLLPMLGVETSSTRLKASMLEIEETITTWPQLASGVILGGGICTDVCRRILLNQLHDSGRYFVDLEDIILDKKNTSAEVVLMTETPTPLSNEEILKLVSDLIISKSENQITPTNSQIQTIVEAATKAPSGGNAQAWKWYFIKGNLFLLHDTSRSNSLLDFDNLASYISFGAAIENLVLQSHSLGLNVLLNEFPNELDLRVICQITFTNITIGTKESAYDYLVNEIDVRVTNRTVSERKLIDIELLSQLKKIASSIEGANMLVIDTVDELHKIANVISSVERLRMLHQRGHADFVNEIRWTNEENENKRDGVDLNTVDITETEKAGFIVSKNWDVVNTLKSWNKGAAYKKLTNKTILNSSAVCLLTMPKYSPINFINAGRSIQRTWLAASKMDISFQPQSPATFFFARLLKGGGIELDKATQQELKILRSEFESVTKLSSDVVDVFLFRLCIADQPKTKSLRRKMEDVLIFSTKN